METNIETNQLLLKAMFALNEAGDDLDEIMRIGLQTAVSPSTPTVAVSLNGMNENFSRSRKRVYSDHHIPNCDG